MRKALLVLSAAALALAGCGDDDTPDTATDEPTTSVSEALPTSSAPTTTAAAAASTVKCESVGFTPNSEDAASDITATGLDCEEARAFVRKVGPRTSSGGPTSVTVDGYRCVQTRTEEDPLPRSFYECENASRKVTFVRS